MVSLEFDENKMREAIAWHAAQRHWEILNVQEEVEYVDEFAIKLTDEDIKDIANISLEFKDLMAIFDIRNKEHVDSYISLSTRKMEKQMKQFYNEEMAISLAKEKLVYIYLASKNKKKKIVNDNIAPEIIDIVVNMAQTNLGISRKNFKKFVSYLWTKVSVQDATLFCKEEWLDISEEKIIYTLKMMKKFYQPMVKNSSPTVQLNEQQAQRNLARTYMDAGLKDITDHDNILDLSAEQWEQFMEYLDKKYEAGELNGDFELPSVQVTPPTE